ncbi:MAG: Tetratricopeptide 2 repeat protein [Candidatus Solibacter sp.]|nr:Tetratricopeptide 2 repeat protein [Candidatus Solibacter sp.]
MRGVRVVSGVMLGVLPLLAGVDATRAETLLRSGLVALQQNRLAGARQDLEAASRADAGNPVVWASLAQAYWRLHQQPEALRAAQTAEKLGRGDGTVAHLLAIFYGEAADLKRAAFFERAYAVSRNADVGAAGRAAVLSLDAGEPELGLSFARQAAARNESPANLNLLGRIQIAAGQPDDGVANLAAAWTADRQNERFCFDYAQALLHRDDFEGAASALEHGLKVHPRSAQLQLALGVARYGQRRFDDAIDSFLKTIRLDSSVEQPYLFLGRMLDQAGPRLAEITDQYRAWNRRQPGDYRGSLFLAKALSADAADSAVIEKYLRRAISLNPDSWEAHFELGVLLSKQRDFAKAAAELARSVALNPREPAPHYHLARMYDRLGQADRAAAERELHEQLSSARNGAPPPLPGGSSK